MSLDGVKATPDQPLLLLDELQSLLNEQIRLVRKGKFSATETMAEETGRLIEELGRIDVPERIEIRKRIERLVKSYRIIIFSVAAEKDRVEKQLQQIGQGRKTLRTYRGVD